MIIPPFIANAPDDTHCVNAVFRMLLAHFRLPDLSWDEIDRRTWAIPGMGTWTVGGDILLAQSGIRVRNIEPVDYSALSRDGVGYLYTIFGDETARYYINRSNIVSVIPHIPEFLACVAHETRRADTDEILDMLRDGTLIGATVNSAVLNEHARFALHYVLLYGYDGNRVHLHDPGLPPYAGRTLTRNEFDACFNYAGGNGGIDTFTPYPLAGQSK